MSTVGFYFTLPGSVQVRCAPGVWQYPTAASLRDAVRLGFLDVVASDDSALLAELAGQGCLTVLVLAGASDDVPDAETLLRCASGVLSPWASTLDALRVHHPWYQAAHATAPLRLRRPGRAPQTLGERPVDWRRAGVVAWTGRAEPNALQCARLASWGRPLVAPRRGVLIDLVGVLGGALVEDRLGASSEVASLEAAAGLPLLAPSRTSAPALLEGVLAAVRHLTAATPPLDLAPPADGVITAQRPHARPAAAQAIEAFHVILGFAPGTEADAFMVRARERRRVPRPHRARVAPRLTGCLLLGDPRPTLDETLRSLEGVVSELVVGLTAGPDGRPADWGRTAGVPVTQLDLADWDRDFASARNRLLEQCTGEHALSIDDDERLVGGEALRELTAWRSADAASVAILNLNPNGSVTRQVNVRLVRLGAGLRFASPLHEVVDVEPRRVASLPRPYLVHYGYSDPRGLRMRNEVRNPDFLAHHLGGPSPDGRLFGVRLRDALIGARGGKLPTPDLCDAVWAFQANVVQREDWGEYLVWSEAFTDALALLRRGRSWRFVVADGGGGTTRTVTFLEHADLDAFMRWWVASQRW